MRSFSFLWYHFLGNKSRAVHQLQHHHQTPGRWDGITEEEWGVVEEPKCSNICLQICLKLC